MVNDTSSEGTEILVDPGSAIRQLFQALEAALQRVEVADALNAFIDLRQSIGHLQLIHPLHREALEAEEGRLLRRVLRPLRDCVNGESEDPAAALARAQLALEVADAATRLRQLPEALPPWLTVLERQVSRSGAGHWRTAATGLPEARQRIHQHHELRLLMRLRELSDPVPIGLQRSLERLLSEQIDTAVASGTSDPQATAELVTWAKTLAGESRPGSALGAAMERLRKAEEQQPDAAEASRQAARWRTVDADEMAHQLSYSVADWLEVAQCQPRKAEVSLEFVPGARLVPHQQHRISFNLAAVIADHDLSVLDHLIAAFFEKLKGCAEARQFLIRHPVSSLYESLGHAWNAGDRLQPEAVGQLSYGITSWTRASGPGALGARLEPPRHHKANLSDGGGVVRPSKVDLAALQVALHRQADVEPTLATIRRNHWNQAWMQSSSPSPWFVSTDVQAHLCQLHTQAGFYANSLSPVDCFQRWCEGTLSALTGLQVVAGDAGAWFFPVAQRISEESGKVPPIHLWPSDEEIYNLLAGNEVVLVSPLAGRIEAHHRSGKLFELFEDLQIRPYGLRCVEAPDSIYPHRPASGFSESLDGCLEAIDLVHKAKPFDVLVAACGAYSLPICAAVQQRYGATCLADGERMHAYFGMRTAAADNWRASTRREEHWIDSGPADAGP